MKTFFIALSAICCSGITSFVSAATTATYSGGSAGYAGTDGSELVGGYLHAGYYTVNPVGLNSQDLRDAFQTFDSLTTPTDSTGYIQEGTFSNDATPETAPWGGLRIFLVATDTPAVQDAGQIAVFTNTALDTWAFQSSSIDPLARSLSMDADIIGNGNADILAGSEMSLGGFPTIELVAVIPEPSTVFLSLLGIVGLMRRRR